MLISSKVELLTYRSRSYKNSSEYDFEIRKNMAVTQLKRKYATLLYEAQQRAFAAKQRIKQLHLEESFEIAKLITSKSVLSTCYELDINSEDNDFSSKQNLILNQINCLVPPSL